MRLTDEEVTAIKMAAAEVFGPTAVVRLFGSRVDDSLRGGDIDSHLEIDSPEGERRGAYDFKERLFRMIEPRKVDVVLSHRGGTPRGFERIAYRDGIIL